MAAFNLTAQINLRGPANISQVVSGIRRQLGTIQSTVRFTLDPNAARRTTALNQSLVQLNATLANTTTTARSAADALTLLARASATSGGATSSRNTQGAAAATRTLGDNARRTSQDLGVARTEMEEFGRQGGLAIKRFAAFSVVSGAIFAVTGAIRAGLVEFVAYDKLMVKLKQVTGESAANLNKLSQTISTLSTGLGVSSLELAGVSATLAQAGLSAKDAERSLKALALSSLAPSFDNMNQTVEGSIALMKQFSISAADLESSLGSINAVAARFAVEASDLISAIQRTGGVFASASKGVSEGKDALNEFISVFTSVRATTRESAESIATGLRTIFTRIQRGSTIEALKEFGVTLTDAEGKFVGAYKAVQLLSEGLSRLDPRDLKFGQIVEELGGFRQIGKVIPLIQQFAVAQQALKVAQEGGGSLANDAVTAQMALGNQLMKVREQFMSLIRSIGSSDAFQALAKTALGFASSILKVADALKGLLPALMILGAGKAAKGLVQFGAGFIGGLRRGGVPGQSASTTTGDRLGGALSGAGPSGAGSPGPRPSPDMIANTQAIRASGIVTGGLIVSVNRASDMLVAQIAATQQNSASLEASTQAIRSLIQAINTSSPGSPPLTANAGGAIVRRFARGGFVPGSGSGDTVPAMLEPGEFVIRKKAVDTLGAGNLHKMNKSSGGNISVGGYAGGGAVQKFGNGGISFSMKISELGDQTAITNAAKEKNNTSIVQGGDTITGFLNKRNFLGTQSKETYLKRVGQQMRKDNKQAEDYAGGGANPIWDIAYEEWIQNQLGQGWNRTGDKTYAEQAKIKYRNRYPVDLIGPGMALGEVKFRNEGQVTDIEFISKLLRARLKTGSIPKRPTGFTTSIKDTLAALGTLDIFEIPTLDELSSEGKKKGKNIIVGQINQKRQIGGQIQKFIEGGVAQRKVGYIDTDVLRDPMNQAMVGPAMQDLKITDVNAYKTYLSKLAVSSRKEGSLDKLRTIAGMPGSGKSSLMLGGSQGAVSDNAKLRRTTRFPILRPQDIRSASEVIDTTSTVTPEKLDEYLKAADKIYMLSTSTKEEQTELKRRRGSRDTTGVNLFGRKPGSTSGAETDSGALEAMLGSDIDAKKLRTLGISSDYKLKRKENIEVQKKKIALLHGSLSPSTVGHESLRTAAKAMGMPIEDFLVLISNDEGITSSDSHSLRTAVFDQDFRVLAARAAFKGSMVSKQTNRGFVLPDVMEISQGGSGQRRFVRPEAGSLGMMVAGEGKDLKKYTDKNYKPVQIPRTGGVSGTGAREAILGGNLGQMKKILSPDVFSLVSQHLPQLKNRSSILPRIVEHSKKRQTYSLADVTKELASLPQRIDSKKVASDPEYAAMAAQVKDLRNRRDKINSRASFEPFSILRHLAKRYPETYGLQGDALSTAVKESVLAQGMVAAKRNPRNFGGEIQKFAEGTGRMGVTAKRASPMIGSRIPNDPKFGPFAGLAITDIMARQVLRKPDAKMSLEKRKQYEEVAAYIGGGVTGRETAIQAQKERRVSRSTKAGLVGLLPLGWNKTNLPISIPEYGDITIVERGLGKEHENELLNMQADAEGASTRFAARLQEKKDKATGTQSATQLKTLSKEQHQATGTPNMEGAIIEKALAHLGAPLKKNAKSTRPIDYPGGLGAAAYWFPGIDPNWPTEVKRTIDSDSRSEATAELIKHFKLQSGPAAKKMAMGGKASSGQKLGQEIYGLIEKSGLKNETSSIVQFANNAGYNLEGFKTYLAKRVEQKNAKAGIKTDPKALAESLKEPSFKTSTPAQLALAQKLKGFVDGGVAEEKKTKNYGQIALKDTGSRISASYMPSDNGTTRQGEVTADKRGLLYTVQSSAATQGFGPKLYDIVMEAASSKGSMLTSDRSRVSQAAFNVWKYYYKNRPDVYKTPLDPMNWYQGSDTRMFDPKKFASQDRKTWPPKTDDSWILQTGYRKAPLDINNPKMVQKFANGGAASDTVPAMLTPGEFVINKKAAQSIGYSKLNKMNHADKIQGFASGGAVGGVQRFADGGATGGSFLSSLADFFDRAENLVMEKIKSFFSSSKALGPASPSAPPPSPSAPDDMVGSTRPARNMTAMDSIVGMDTTDRKSRAIIEQAMKKEADALITLSDDLYGMGAETEHVIAALKSAARSINAGSTAEEARAKALSAATVSKLPGPMNALAHTTESTGLTGPQSRPREGLQGIPETRASTPTRPDRPDNAMPLANRTSINRSIAQGSMGPQTQAKLESQLSALTKALGTATAEQRRIIQQKTPVAAVAAAVGRASSGDSKDIAAAEAAMRNLYTEIERVAQVAPTVTFQDILEIDTGPLEASFEAVDARFAAMSQMMERLDQSGQRTNEAFNDVNDAYANAARVLADTGATAEECAAAVRRVQTSLQGVSEQAVVGSSPKQAKNLLKQRQQERANMMQTGLSYASMAVGLAGQVGSNMFNDKTRSGAQGKAATQAATNTASTGIAVASQAAMIPGVGPAVAGLVLVGTAAAAAGNAMIAAHNSVIEFDKALLQTKIGSAMDNVARDFENLSKDIHNANILGTIKTSLQEASVDLSTMMEKQKTQTKAAWGNLLDFQGGGAQQTKRGEVLDTGGLFAYLGVMMKSSKVDANTGRSARDEASNSYMGMQIGSNKEKSKEQAASFKPVADGILQAFNAQMKGIKGTSQQDIFKELKRADGTASDFANTIARANPVINEQILQIENSNTISEQDKQVKIDAMIASEALYQTTLSTNAAMKQLSMDKLENKTRGFVNSFTRSLNNMDTALNITTFELDKLGRQSELSREALSGNAKAGPMKLDSVNMIQNTRGYTKSEGSAAQSQAADFFGSQSKTMSSMLKVANTMEDSILSSINRTIKKDPKASDEKIGAQLRTSISGALTSLELPADLSDKLAKQTQEAVKSMRKEGNDTIDFGQLVEQVPALGKALTVAKEAQEMAIKALEAWQNNLNDYAEAMNQNVGIQIEMNGRLRKASDIRGQSKMELKKTLGREPISLNEQVTLSRQNTKTQTGGLTNPADIALKVGKLENLRQAQQGMSDTAGNRGLGGKDEFKMMQDRLKNTNTALRENYDALKNMAENTDQASLAMSRINELQQKQQAGVGIAERVATSNAQELSDLNNAMSRLSNNMRGQTNGSTTSDQRKQSLDAFNMIAPYLGERQSGIKANVLESMLQESGQGVNPMMADIIQSLRNPEADPEMAAAVQAYKEGNELQAMANTSLADISKLMADNTSDIAADKLSKAMTGATMSFESATLSDINKDIKTLIAQGADGPGKNAAGKAFGGVVYAAMGQKINFTPKGTDTVPAMLTPGEFVVNRSATQQHLPLLRQINSTGLHSGGSVNYLSRGGIALGKAPGKTDHAAKPDSELRYRLAGGPQKDFYNESKTKKEGFENMLAFNDMGARPVASPVTRLNMPRFAVGDGTDEGPAVWHPSLPPVTKAYRAILGESYGTLATARLHSENQSTAWHQARPGLFYRAENKGKENWPSTASIDAAFQKDGDSFKTSFLPFEEKTKYLESIKRWIAESPDVDSSLLKLARDYKPSTNEKIQPKLTEMGPDFMELSGLTLPADDEHSILTRDPSLQSKQQDTLGFRHIQAMSGLWSYGNQLVSGLKQMTISVNGRDVQTSSKIKDSTKSIGNEREAEYISSEGKTIIPLVEALKEAELSLTGNAKERKKRVQNKTDVTMKQNLRNLTELYDGTKYRAVFGSDVINQEYNPPLTLYSPTVTSQVFGDLMRNTTEPEGSYSKAGTEIPVFDTQEGKPIAYKHMHWTDSYFQDENLFKSQEIEFDKQNKNISSTPEVYGAPGDRYHFSYKKVKAKLYDAAANRYWEEPHQDFITVQKQSDKTSGTNPFSTLRDDQAIYSKDITSLIALLNATTPAVGQKSGGDPKMYKYGLQELTKADSGDKDDSYIGTDGRNLLIKPFPLDAKEYGLQREKLMDNNELRDATASVAKQRQGNKQGETVKGNMLNQAKRVTIARNLYTMAKDPNIGNINLQGRKPESLQDVTAIARELTAAVPANLPMGNPLREKIDAFRAFFTTLQNTDGRDANVNDSAMLRRAGISLKDSDYTRPKRVVDPMGVPAGVLKDMYFDTGPNIQSAVMSIIKNQMMGKAAAKSVSTLNDKQKEQRTVKGGKFQKSGFGKDPEAEDIPDNFLDLYNRAFDPRNVYPDVTSRAEDIMLMMAYWKDAKNADGSLTFDPKLSAMMNAQAMKLAVYYRQQQDPTENTGLTNDPRKENETDDDYRTRLLGLPMYSSYQRNIQELQHGMLEPDLFTASRDIAQKEHEGLGANASFGPLPTVKEMIDRLLVSVDADTMLKKKQKDEKQAQAIATGGMVYASSGKLINYQPRGTDTVPAMLTPGEFVINRASTQKHLPVLKAINSGTYSRGDIVQHLSNGGMTISSPNYLRFGRVAPDNTGTGTGGFDFSGFMKDLTGQIAASFSSVMEEFSKRIQDTKSTSTNGVSNNKSSSSDGISSFLSKLDNIAKVLAGLQIPSDIKITGRHDVNVIINGDKVLSSLSPSLQGLVTEAINQKINDIRNANPELAVNFNIPTERMA